MFQGGGGRAPTASYPGMGYGGLSRLFSQSFFARSFAHTSLCSDATFTSRKPCTASAGSQTPRSLEQPARSIIVLHLFPKRAISRDRNAPRASKHFLYRCVDFKLGQVAESELTRVRMRRACYRELRRANRALRPCMWREGEKAPGKRVDDRALRHSRLLASHANKVCFARNCPPNAIRFIY